MSNSSGPIGNSKSQLEKDNSNSNRETVLTDFLKPSLYLFEKLHPLYVAIAKEEKKVYFGLIGKKRKANAAKIAYERLLGLTAQPLAEISKKREHATKSMPQNYADGMIELYRLFIDMIESRISVLKEFMKSGLTKEVKNFNQRMLNKCSAYDSCYKLMSDQTQRHCQICLMMSPFDNIHDFLAVAAKE